MNVAPLPLLPVGWASSPGLTPYPAAVAVMEARAAAIAAGCGDEIVWLLEHPPLYTAGLSARAEDLLDASRFPIHKTERGGQLTYHGPGQRVAYTMLDLRRRGRDVRGFVLALEHWLIAALAELGVEGVVKEGRVGVWVERPGREDKIAAIGVRVKKWATLHGVSLNVAPDLSHFSGIVPCGIREHGVTSLEALGIAASMADVDAALRQGWIDVMGPLTDAACPLTDAAVDANGDLI